jgi:hypothetical protein
MAVQPAFHTLFLSTANTSHRWDLNDLFHPAKAFDRPSDVVGDPDLTLNEKRPSWPRSDACALEAAPSSPRTDREAPDAQ